MSEQTSLVAYGTPRRGGYLSPSEALETGKLLAQSQFFPEAKDAARAAAKILMGQEMGLPPMASMKNIYVTDNKGKPVFQVAAATQLALVRQSGRYDYKIVQRSAEKAGILFERFQVLGSGERVKLEEYLSEYTKEDAERAGNWDKATYTANPKNMLFWRAASTGVNAFCPDVLCGPFYAEGEIEGGLMGEPIQAEARVVASEPLPNKRLLDLEAGAPRLATPVAAPVCVTGAALQKAIQDSVRHTNEDLLAVDFTATKDQRISAAAADPVQSAQPSASADTPASTPEESLDRTAAAAGIKAGDGPLAPDGPATSDEETLANLIPITHARGLIKRIQALGDDEKLATTDAKDVNNYLKELLPGAGAKAAWNAVGVEIKPGVTVTRSQVLKLASYLAK